MSTIGPFHLAAPQADLDQLHERLIAAAPEASRRLLSQPITLQGDR